MSFLKEMLRDKKLLEMEVDLDNFMKEKNLSNRTMIYEMSFDMEVFQKEEEVREYLKDKFLSYDEIQKTDKEFNVSLANKSQFDEDTIQEIELRRGLKCSVGDLREVPHMEEIRFNDKDEIMLASKVGAINLNMGVPNIIEIARVAEGEHPAYGKVKITKEDLKSFVNNFKENVTGVDLAVNEDHKKFEAFGWFKDIFLNFEENVLYGQVSWNSKGITALDGKQYRYFSPELRFNYVHPHTGVEHGPTLLGGALTNYPFLKMDAITELSNKFSNKGKANMSTETISLSDHNEKVVELSTKVNELTSSVNSKDAEIVALNAKVKELEQEKTKSMKEKTYDKLFNEGKISKAQLDALKEDKSMLEVLALSENMSTTPKGDGGTPKVSDSIELSEDEKAFCKEYGLTEEEYILANKVD